MPSERPVVVRWLKFARDITVCCADIAVFKAATVYHETQGLPYKAQLVKLVTQYSERRLPRRCSLPYLILESAAAGSNEALLTLRSEHPTLSFERDVSGAVVISSKAR